MRNGEFRFRTLARLLAAAILIFGMWGVGMVLTFQWLGLADTTENIRRLEEAELRPTGPTSGQSKEPLHRQTGPA